MSTDSRDIKSGRIVAVRQKVQIELADPNCVAHFVSFDGFELHEQHFAVLFEPPVRARSGAQEPIVRIHSECITGDVFGSLRCDCGEQLKEAYRIMADRGGILLYLRQEGRGIGLVGKLDAYRQQDAGHDTFEANRILGFPEDARDYSSAAEMLMAIGVHEIRLLTNNPDKVSALQSQGITVVEVIATGVFVNKRNFSYLNAKKTKHGHNIAL